MPKSYRVITTQNGHVRLSRDPWVGGPEATIYLQSPTLICKFTHYTTFIGVPAVIWGRLCPNISL